MVPNQASDIPSCASACMHHESPEAFAKDDSNTAATFEAMASEARFPLHRSCRFARGHSVPDRGERAKVELQEHRR